MYQSPTMHDIATSLDRDPPVYGSREWERWAQLVGDAERQIRHRLGPLDDLVADDVAFVVREAVAMRLRAGSASSQPVRSVGVDDGRVEYFAMGQMGLAILDEWWALLTPGGGRPASALTFQPTFEPDGYGCGDPWPIAGAVDIIPPRIWP